MNLCIFFFYKAGRHPDVILKTNTGFVTKLTCDQILTLPLNGSMDLRKYI